MPEATPILLFDVQRALYVYCLGTVVGFIAFIEQHMFLDCGKVKKIPKKAVTIPEMLHSCENKLHLDRRVTRFVIPFSVALSANGSAVFIACSCLFISSLTGNAASASSVIVIGLLAAIVSLAIPSAPSSSIVTIIMILTSLNISIEAIALLLAVDFFLDRLRTTSSVVSHCMCAAVTHHMCKADLQDPDKYGLDIEKDIATEAKPLNNTDRENVMDVKM